MAKFEKNFRTGLAGMKFFFCWYVLRCDMYI